MNTLDDIETAIFLIDYFNLAVSKNDTVQIAWVANQVGMSISSTECKEKITEIEDKLKRNLRTRKSSVKFGL